MSDRKIHSLDGLRGLAALSVVFSHIFTIFYSYLHIGLLSKQVPGKYAEQLFNSPFTFFYKGNSAVMLFFVMSGFVLSYSLIRKGVSESFLKTAVLKRYIRLNIPVAASILICACLMYVHAFTFNDTGVKLPLSFAYTGEVSFIEAIKQSLYGAIIFGKQNYNYVLWTIKIEFFGSLLVYFLIVFFAKNITVLRIICLMITITTIFGEGAQIWSYGLFTAGIFLATFNVYSGKSKWRLSLCVVLLVVGIYLFGFNPDSRSYHFLQNKIDYVTIHWMFIHSRDLMPIFGVLMISSCIVINNNIFKALSLGVFQWLGKVSFSAYLIHTMLIAIIAPYVVTYFGTGVHAIIACIALVIPATLFASHYFYLYIDKPATEKAGGIAAKIDMLFSSKRVNNSDGSEIVS
jgi:peptidoglycan/LPS O-acetylase OafA/YrhL